MRPLYLPGLRHDCPLRLSVPTFGAALRLQRGDGRRGSCVWANARRPDRPADPDPGGGRRAEAPGVAFRAGPHRSLARPRPQRRRARPRGPACFGPGPDPSAATARIATRSGGARPLLRPTPYAHSVGYSRALLPDHGTVVGYRRAPPLAAAGAPQPGGAPESPALTPPALGGLPSPTGLLVLRTQGVK